MKRKWLSLRIDISQLDPEDLPSEWARIAGLLMTEMCALKKSMAPVYDTHGQFLGVWKIFEGEEAPAYEMTTPNPRSEHATGK